MGRRIQALKKFTNVVAVSLVTVAVASFGYAAYIGAQRDKQIKEVKKDIENLGYDIKDLNTTMHTERSFMFGYFTFDFVTKDDKHYKAYYYKKDFKPGNITTSADYAKFFEKAVPCVEEDTRYSNEPSKTEKIEVDENNITVENNSIEQSN